MLLILGADHQLYIIRACSRRTNTRRRTATAKHVRACVPACLRVGVRALLSIHVHLCVCVRARARRRGCVCACGLRVREYLECHVLIKSSQSTDAYGTILVLAEQNFYLWSNAYAYKTMMVMSSHSRSYDVCMYVCMYACMKYMHV